MPYLYLHVNKIKCQNTEIVISNLLQLSHFKALIYLSSLMTFIIFNLLLLSSLCSILIIKIILFFILLNIKTIYFILINGLNIIS